MILLFKEKLIGEKETYKNTCKNEYKPILKAVFLFKTAQKKMNYSRISGDCVRKWPSQQKKVNGLLLKKQQQKSGKRNRFFYFRNSKQ